MQLHYNMLCGFKYLYRVVPVSECESILQFLPKYYSKDLTLGRKILLYVYVFSVLAL